MAQRFIALGAEDKLSMLEMTWNGLPEDHGRLYDALQGALAQATSDAANGVQSQANNSHSAQAFLPGEDRPSTTEYVRAWQWLISLYRSTNYFLSLCAQNGFDAFQVVNNGQWPNFLPAPLSGDAAVIVDPNNNWARLCLKYMVNTDLVINQTLQNEYAIWLWMIESIFPVTESRADRRFFYLGQGGYIS